MAEIFIPKLKPAFDSAEKEKSRKLITEFIIDRLGSRNISSMVEFIGEGIGAEYYLENFDIKQMFLIESNKKSFDFWFDYKAPKLIPKYKDTVDFKLRDMSMHEFLHMQKVLYPEDKLQVVNMDFCSWFYDNPKNLNSPGSLIRNIFENKMISNKGILLLTFMLKGWGLNMPKRIEDPNVLRSEESILAFIFRRAMDAGIIIDKNIFSYTYSPNNKTTMLNLGLQVQY